VAPLLLKSNGTLNHSTQSIAIYNSTVYFGDSQTSPSAGLVSSFSLATSSLLASSIDISAGGKAFPQVQYRASVLQLRADSTGRLHLIDPHNFVIICLSLDDGQWQSVVKIGWGGIGTFDVSPDGETYYVWVLGTAGIVAIDRSTGNYLPFDHPISSIAYGPDGSMWIANNGDTWSGLSIDRISSNGTVLSSLDLSPYSALQLQISALVVDAHSNFIFISQTGSNCNDLCVLFPASGNLRCWQAVSGYATGLAYDPVTDQITAIRGFDDYALYTFAPLVDSEWERAPEPIVSAVLASSGELASKIAELRYRRHQQAADVQ